MKKRTTSFRCPPKLLAEIDVICAANRISRTSLLIMSLRRYLLLMSKQGLIQPKRLDFTPHPQYTSKPRPYHRKRATYPSESDDDLGLLAAEQHQLD